MKPISTAHTLLSKTIAAILLLSLLASCSKKETLETITLEELMPLAKGKFITYRVDSLVSVNNGSVFVTNRYQVRHRVDSLGVDNLNQPIWIINTFINDSTASGPWVQNGQLTVKINDKRVEVTENNLKFIKLQLPVKENFTWQGNSFLPDAPYAAYATSISLALWPYSYESVDLDEKIGTATIPGVTTVFHIDESTGLPVTDRTKYASVEKSLEKFAKGIGLVYREHYVWENQPNIQAYVGFGIKMWMVNHN